MFANAVDSTPYQSQAAADMRAVQAVKNINSGEFTIPRCHVAQYSRSISVWSDVLENEFMRWAWHVEGGALPSDVLPLLLNIEVDRNQGIEILPYACFIQIGAQLHNGRVGNVLEKSEDAELMREVQKHRAWKGRNAPMTVYQATLTDAYYFITNVEQKRFYQMACQGSKKPFYGTPLELHFPKKEKQDHSIAYACTIVRGERLPIAWLS